MFVSDGSSLQTKLQSTPLPLNNSKLPVAQKEH